MVEFLIYVYNTWIKISLGKKIWISFKWIGSNLNELQSKMDLK